MEIDINADRIKIEEDLGKVQRQLSLINQRRSELLQQMFMLKGILQYLNSKNKVKEATHDLNGNADRPKTGPS